MNEKIKAIIENAEYALKDEFSAIDANALKRQKDVLDAFRTHNVGQRHFAPTNGYGYDDIARDTLCALYADVFKAESAIVSPLIVSGTHALSLCLFGILRPGDTMLAVTGAPYDTLQTVIGGKGNGSLADFGVKYRQVDFDMQKMREILAEDRSVKLVAAYGSFFWADRAATNGATRSNLAISRKLSKPFAQYAKTSSSCATTATANLSKAKNR